MLQTEKEKENMKKIKTTFETLTVNGRAGGEKGCVWGGGRGGLDSLGCWTTVEKRFQNCDAKQRATVNGHNRDFALPFRYFYCITGMIHTEQSHGLR